MSAYTVPIETEEAAGALAWNEITRVMVRAFACGGGDCLNISELWRTMVRALGNLGRPGTCSMAISAVENALWDLEARLLHVAVADLLTCAHRRQLEQAFFDGVLKPSGGLLRQDSSRPRFGLECKMPFMKKYKVYGNVTA